MTWDARSFASWCQQGADVLDHVGDVAAEGSGVEVRAPDDVPADAAREADLVVVGQPAGKGALVPHEVGVVALGVDNEPAHLPLGVGGMEVDELGGEGVLRRRGLGGSRSSRDEDPRVHAFLRQDEPTWLLRAGAILVVRLADDDLGLPRVERVGRERPSPTSLRASHSVNLGKVQDGTGQDGPDERQRHHEELVDVASRRRLVKHEGRPAV